MEFKGTKREWDLRSYTRGNNLYSNTYVIKNGLFKEHDANALLISKAPEMLEMLIKCTDALNKTTEYDVLERYQKLVDDANKLITEATTL